MTLDIIVIPGDPGANEIYQNYRFARTMDAQVAHREANLCAMECTHQSSCARFYGGILDRTALRDAIAAPVCYEINSDIYSHKMAQIKTEFRKYHQKPYQIGVYHHLENGDEVLVPNPDDEQELVVGFICEDPSESRHFSVMVSIDGKHISIGRDKVTFLKRYEGVKPHAD